MRAACYVNCAGLNKDAKSKQLKAVRAYARKRKWEIVLEVLDTDSDPGNIKNRYDLIRSATKREFETVIVWRLDRWSNSLMDLLTSLRDLAMARVGFVSTTEKLDLSASSAKDLVPMLDTFTEFEQTILSNRIKAGIVKARSKGGLHGRPVSAGKKASKVKFLYRKGISQAEIARRLQIGRTSVRRLVNS